MLSADSGQIFTLVPPDNSLPHDAIGTAEIHGMKWNDVDGNGYRDSGEAGLAGVSIYIDADNNGALDEGELSTVTAADNSETQEIETGQYSFTGLAAGTYVVREVVPSGFQQTFPLPQEREFDIEVVFPDNTLSDEAKEIFELAAARWEALIIGDIPDVNVPGLGLIDDLRIQASGPDIDGEGGILGQAGPTFVRTGSFLPAAGIMEFDSADIEALIEEGQFDEVVLHEMGHVLGLGTIWEALNLLIQSGTDDARFIGPQATQAYNEIFGVNGSSVPVESTLGGGGTLYSHWSEGELDNELMTGFLNSNQDNPLSRITVGQMADLGYQVNLHAADDYEPPAQAVRSGPPAAPISGRLEVLNLPWTYVDPLPAAAGPSGPALVTTADEGFWSVELADGEIANDIDFGNKPLPGSIQGVKWNDRDGDGIQDPNEPTIKNWTIFLDEDGNGELAHDEETFESDVVPVDIVDRETGESTISVEGMGGSVLDVNVTLDITHTFDADLSVVLVSPSGKLIVLFSNVGGSGNNFVDTTFDDEAAAAITSGTPPFTNTFRPEVPLSIFDGEDPNGEWTLQVTDEFDIDLGSLNSWSLSIVSGERSTTTDDNGEYRFEDLAAGDYTVAEVLLEDWVQSFPGGDEVHNVSLEAGQELVGINFGNHAGFIGGRIWDDYDGDGQQDEGEPALAGWTVYLDQNENGIFDNGPTTVASTGPAVDIVDLGQTDSHLTVAGLGAIPGHHCHRKHPAHV